jgi:hypothetical protein
MDDFTRKLSLGRYYGHSAILQLDSAAPGRSTNLYTRLIPDPRERRPAIHLKIAMIGAMPKMAKAASMSLRLKNVLM